MDELLRCDSLSMQYGSKTALDSISLSIPRGVSSDYWGRTEAAKPH